MEELRERVALNLRLIALRSDLDLSPCRRPSLSDVVMAGKVLRQDLGIAHVSPSSFSFGPRKDRLGAPVAYNPIPEFLRDI